MASVFVSYARNDARIARALIESLERQGYYVWWDSRLHAGELFYDVIKSRLDASDAVIVIWSRSSVKSDWVYSEAQAGDADNKLVTVCTGDVSAADIPLPFGGRHTVLFSDTESIKSAIVSILSSRGVDTPTAAATPPATPTQEATLSPAGWTVIMACVLFLLSISSFIGYHAGVRDSPDYNKLDQAYLYIGSNFRLIDRQDGGLNLMVKAGTRDYFFDSVLGQIKGNISLPGNDELRPRYISREIYRLATLMARVEVPALAGAGLTHAVTSSTQLIAGKTRITRVSKGTALFYVFWVAAGAGGPLGYWIGHYDSKAYDSNVFQQALQDTEFWSALAAKLQECTRDRMAERTKVALDRSKYRPERVLEELARDGLDIPEGKPFRFGRGADQSATILAFCRELRGRDRGSRDAGPDFWEAVRISVYGSQ